VGILYDAVAGGMLAYSRAAFRVRVLASRFRLEPGTLIVSTHRRETDVPLICPALYFGGRVWRYRWPRMSFAARDDMFLPGFFAGFPPDLSPRARRVLYPLGVARWLPVVQVHPIRSASVARLGEMVRAQPEAALEELAPDGLHEPFRERAAELGLPVPRTGNEVLHGEYADLLWRAVTPAEAAGPDGFWARRGSQAAEDFRGLVELIRRGEVLLVFPEGQPSPDGEIGPLRRGLSALVRRGKPSRILPVTLAYDPLVRRRTHAFVAIGSAVAPPEVDAEREVLALLRLRTPLTCGQFVASRLVDGVDPTAEELVADVEAAREEGRPVDPDLLSEEGRRSRLAEALAAAPSHEDQLAFLAREYRSARAAGSQELAPE
jgi:Acyltransferase